MFKSDRVYVDGQLEALKLRVEWLENELKYQSDTIKGLVSQKSEPVRRKEHICEKCGWPHNPGSMFCSARL